MPPSPLPRPSQLLALAAVALLLASPMAAVASPVAEDDRASHLYVEPGLEYVAIAPTHLARYLGPLIEWKMDRGVPAQIFYLDQVLGAYPGRDDAERLHNFLQDLYYNETDGSPQWLLLAGDSDQVPVRYLWANRDHTGRKTMEHNLYVGDMYYSGLGSDWDADGDDVFGEPGEEDPTPELYVGRIAASFPEELEAAVAKTLSYELDPPGGDWFDNAYLAGALMDEPNRLDDPYTLPGQGGYSDEGFDPYADNAWEVTQKVRAVLGEGYDIIELNDYPVLDGCHYNASVDTLNRLSSVASWNRGNALVFWACHGYEAFGGLAEYEGTGWSGMFESARPFITWEDTADNVTGGMLPLVYISSCYAGQFDRGDQTNFESMLTVPEGGAIALISGDGDTFRLENISARSLGNWWLSERFWQLVVQEGAVRPGEALGRLKAEYHEHYRTEGPPPEDSINLDYFYANLYAYNLQGDPEVPVWVGAPGRLTLQVMGGAVVNSPTVRLRVTDEATGDPVEGARVFARDAGLPTTMEAVTGPDGVAVIEAGPTELDGGMRIAATKENMVPARMVVNVTAGIRDLFLDDAGVVGPSTLEFDGGVVSYDVTVANVGDFSASAVAVRFDSGDTDAPDEDGVNGRYQTRVMDLAPGEAIALTFGHRYTYPGQYGLSFEMDPDDTLSEDNELNNRAVRQLLLRPLPTLPASVGPIQVQAGRVHDWPLDLDFYVEVANGFSRRVVFELDHATEGVGAWISEGNLLYLRPARSAFGTATVTVVMYSEGVLADEMTIVLDIVPANDPPVIAPIADQQVFVGEELRLPINASDPDGHALTLIASLDGATVDGGVLRWTPGTADVGVRFPTVTATDPLGGATQFRFRVDVVRRNSVPTVSGFEDTIEAEEGEVVHVTVNAIDVDGDRLTYQLVSAHRTFSIDPATGLVTFDGTDLGPGTYTTRVLVSDGEASVQRTLSVVVEGPSDLPVFALMVLGVLLVCVLVASYMFRK